jgi:hypothetical protein
MFGNFENKKSFEQKYAIRNRLIEESIDKADFPLKVLLLMVQESDKRDAWIKVLTGDKATSDLIEVVDELGKSIDGIFKRSLLMEIIKRNDCPHNIAIKYGEEIFPDVAEQDRKKKELEITKE